MNESTSDNPIHGLRANILGRCIPAMLAVKAMLLIGPDTRETVADDAIENLFANLLDERPKHLAAEVQRDASNISNHAALVFMHSVYELAVFDLIRTLVNYDPDSWNEWIDKKKLEFGVLRTSSQLCVQRELLEKFLNDLEQQSFPKKVQRLLKFLKPRRVKGVVKTFDFRLDDFSVIDKLRHRVTHEPDFSEPIHDLMGKLDYMHKTLIMLIQLAEAKYDGASKEA